MRKFFFGPVALGQIFAAFLQEAASLLAQLELLEVSEQVTQVGDLWREFAVRGARCCKNNEHSPEAYAGLAEILRSCASVEQELFAKLLKVC